ncbi:MAG: precorrin-8X methylmutase [Micromonosporaceae bacterium]
MSRTVPPIEMESYRILRTKVDTNGMSRRTRDVVERVVHSTADLDYVTDLVCDESALASGAAALAEGASLVVDDKMVATGVGSRESFCMADLPAVAEIAERYGISRSAAGIRLAAEVARVGAVWVIGAAPTALTELLNLSQAGRVRPALVVGFPVGLLGAVEAKEALRESGLPQVSNISSKGGAVAAVAVIRALLEGDPLTASAEPE